MGVASLIEGYSRFKKNKYQDQRELYQKLEEEGQSPKVLFIACCDSRCDPSIITDSSPGELFVVRNVANLVPKYTPDGSHHGTSAGIEFAVRHLKVEHVVVMGHAQCGGIKLLLESAGKTEAEDDFLTSWMEYAIEARDKVIRRVEKDQEINAQLALEHEAIRLSLSNLMTFDWLRERVENDNLQLHGWYFGIAKGQLQRLNPDSNEFEIMEYD